MGAREDKRSIFDFVGEFQRPCWLNISLWESVLNLASLWGLHPSVTYLNHGSFGACPSAVLAVQAALRLEMEQEPVDFLTAALPARLGAAREALAQFLGADAADLVFVPNATAGVNAVLRSITLEPADELLITTHTYAACRKTVEFVAARSGARVVVADLPFPCRDDENIIAAVLQSVSARTRLALIDHVTSPTALILPAKRLIDELQARGIDTLVDGAHAPGMVPLALSGLGAAYYTGNAHKWLCAPKGAAFLHVRRDRQARVHPNVISHGYTTGFHAEFDWTGTSDPTPWLCIPESIRFIGDLLPGGWPEVMARNRALALQARGLVLDAVGVESPCPGSMIGSMASIPLPHGLDCKGLHDWFRARGIETWVHPNPVPLLRVSAQLYNNLDQFRLLARLLEEALRGH
jgi:isopenicillin-N epimerase